MIETLELKYRQDEDESFAPSIVRLRRRMHKQGGNGHTKGKILLTDMGHWLRVCPEDENAFLPPDFAVHLSRALNEWMNKNPEKQIMQIVPIQKGGMTMELHVWFG